MVFDAVPPGRAPRKAWAVKSGGVIAVRLDGLDVRHAVVLRWRRPCGATDTQGVAIRHNRRAQPSTDNDQILASPAVRGRDEYTKLLWSVAL